MPGPAALGRADIERIEWHLRDHAEGSGSKRTFAAIFMSSGLDELAKKRKRFAVEWKCRAAALVDTVGGACFTTAEPHSLPLWNVPP